MSLKIFNHNLRSSPTCPFWQPGDTMTQSFKMWTHQFVIRTYIILFFDALVVGQRPGAGIMEADDRQVTTVFTVQPSFHDRPSANRVSWSVTIVGKRWGGVWPSLANVQSLLTSSFTDDGNASWCWVCQGPIVEHFDGWTVKTVVTWRSSASMIPAPGQSDTSQQLVSVCGHCFG